MSLMGWSLWPRSKPEEKPAALPAPAQAARKKICCACPDTKVGCLGAAATGVPV